jgi:hypothetical protein
LKSESSFFEGGGAVTTGAGVDLWSVPRTSPILLKRFSCLGAEWVIVAVAVGGGVGACCSVDFLSSER